MTTWFPATCPTCGYKMDGHSAIGAHDAVPKTGDYTVCIACGSLAVYQDVLGTLTLHLPTGAEREEAMRNPLLVAAMLAQRQARSEDPNWPQGPKDVSDA